MRYQRVKSIFNVKKTEIIFLGISNFKGLMDHWDCVLAGTMLIVLM